MKAKIFLLTTLYQNVLDGKVNLGICSCIYDWLAQAAGM